MTTKTEKGKKPSEKAEGKEVKQLKPAEETLADKVRMYNRLHKKVKLRERFQSTLDVLNDTEVKPDAPYDSDEYQGQVRFTFENGHTKIMKVSQPDIVEELRQFLIGKVGAQMEKLTAEIMA